MGVERRYDVDWLRIFATYLLFPFHVCKVFDGYPYYHIKNAELSWGLAYFSGFVHQWHMPLFFLLAGWSLHASMSFRGVAGVLRERILRIFIPLIFGICTLCVFLGYVENDLMKERGLTFAQFLPRFFTSLDFFTWGHLWFLVYLFTFTLLYMPLFARLTRNPPSWTFVSARALYMPLIPLTFAQLLLRIWWPGMQNLYNDWANFVYYSAFLIMGFLMGSVPGISDAIDREWKRAAKIALALTPPFLIVFGGREWNDVIRHIGYHVLGASLGYCVIIAALGFARTHLNFGNRVSAYLAESAFPVYILHQGGIVFPGWFIIHLAWGIPAKFITLLAISFLLTMTVYHFLVRPFNVLRFVYGMKLRATKS
jgi:hypothetical protein